MSLDLRSLRALVVLTRYANYSRAAEELGISQPTLTRTVQSVERQLGLRLFDRDRSGVRPTAHGLPLIEHATRLLNDAADLERNARLAATGSAGRVAIGMAPLPARALLPAVLGQRLRENPEVRYDVLVRNVDALWPQLIAGEVEFVVGAEGQVPENARIRGEAIGSFALSLMVRDGHPLLGGDDVPHRFPVALTSRRGAAYGVPDSLLDNTAPEFHIVEDYRAMTEVIQKCDAIWLTSPYGSIEDIRAGTLRELPQSANLAERCFNMLIYSIERRTPSPAARQFKDALVRHMRELPRLHREAAKQAQATLQP